MSVLSHRTQQSESKTQSEVKRANTVRPYRYISISYYYTKNLLQKQ